MVKKSKYIICDIIGLLYINNKYLNRQTGLNRYDYPYGCVYDSNRISVIYFHFEKSSCISYLNLPIIPQQNIMNKIV